MELKNRIKEVVISDLSRKAVLQYLVIKNPTIRTLYDSGLIDDKTIETGIENAVINRARDFYIQLTQGAGEYPDNIAMPEVFAYGIYKKIFSEKEMNRIKFDHGLTSETFCERYSPSGLIQKLKQEILNPKSPLFFSTDEHPSCC